MRDFPSGLLIKTSPFNQRAEVRSLVRQLRSHIPCGFKNQNIKKKRKKPGAIVEQIDFLKKK